MVNIYTPFPDMTGLFDYFSVCFNIWCYFEVKLQVLGKFITHLHCISADNLSGHCVTSEVSGLCYREGTDSAPEYIKQ